MSENIDWIEKGFWAIGGLMVGSYLLYLGFTGNGVLVSLPYTDISFTVNKTLLLSFGAICLGVQQIPYIIERWAIKGLTKICLIGEK